MPRPFRCRNIGCRPGSDYFKPRGIPLDALEAVILHLDEFEAMRLADLEGMYQEDAAKKMKVSRQTFGNIVDSAHKKIADAIINSKAIKIEGGEVKMMERKFVCYDCKHEWALPYGTGRPLDCSKCQSNNIHRAPQDSGWARDSRFGRGLGKGNGPCRRISA